MTSSTLRASVTATSPIVVGGPAEILIDGSDTPVDANGLQGYQPTPGDRVLVQLVDSTVEILQFIERGVVPYVDSTVGATMPASASLGELWMDTSVTPNASYTCILAYSAGGTLIGNWKSTDNAALVTRVPTSTTVNGIPLTGNIVLSTTVVLPTAAPASSPAVTATSFALGQIKATWPTVALAESYDVYVKNTSGVTTGDELWGNITGTTAVIGRLAGASLSTSADTFVAVVAKNRIGSALIGADDGATASQVNTQDISNNYTSIVTSQNQVVDPTFQQDIPGAWDVLGGTVTVLPTGARDGGRAVQLNASTGAIQNLVYVPTEGGSSMRLGAYVKSSTVAVAGEIQLLLNVKDAAGTVTLSTPVLNPEDTVAGVWTWVQGIVTLPDSAVQTAFVVQNLSAGTLDIDLVTGTRAMDSSLYVDGSITGIKILSNSIETENLSSTAIDGMTVTGAVVQTGHTGALVRMDKDEGLNSFAPDGSTILSVPIIPDVDGNILAALRAALTATSLTVVDFLALRGVNNEFSKGSVTTLATGTTAPSQPPQPTMGWPVKPRAFGTQLTLGGTGFARDGTDYWVVSSFFGGFMSKFIENTGTFDETATYNLGSWMQPAGITVLGSYVYVLGRDSRDIQSGAYGFGKYFVHKYDKTTGAYISKWQYQPSGTTTGAYSDLNPSMGNNGTDILISQCPNSSGSDNFVYIRRYNTAGVLQATLQTNLATGDHQSSINVGNFDIGSSRYYMTSLVSRVTAYACDASGNLTPNDNFVMPKTALGMVWDGVVFKTITSDGVYIFSQHNWSSSTQDRWWIAHSWYDSNATGSTHETLISSKVSFLMKKRAHLTVTTPPLPATTGGTDDVTGVRIYHGKGATTPAASAMMRSNVDLADGLTVATYSAPLVLSTAANTGTPGPFPLSTPAQIKSTSGGLVINGDGTGAWPLVVPQGKYVATATTNASGFVTVTISPPLPYAPSGWSVNTTNSSQRASVDMGNSSASSIRIYFRTITTAGSPVVVSTAVGPFSWLAFP